MRRKNIFLVLFSIVLVLAHSVPAMAQTYQGTTPIYVFTDQPSTTVTQAEIMLADSSGNNGSTITSVHVAWSVQPGDQLRVIWYDASRNVLSTSSVDATSTTGSNVAVIPPSGSYGAKLQITSSSNSGSRYFWFNDATNSVGNTTVFPDPAGVPSGGSSIVVAPIFDTVSIVNAINQVSSQLNTVISNQGTLQGTLLDQINLIKGQLSSITSQLNTAISNQNTMIDQLNTANNTLGNIKNYLTTPRQASPLSIGNLNPQPVFDPTPPVIPDQEKTPYTYDRPIPQMPTFVDSPGPMPTNPDPTVIPHDNPLSTDAPKTPDTPKIPDSPKIPESPVGTETPLSPEEPLQKDPVNMDAPLSQDPVQMDAPISRDPVNMDTPLSRQPALQPEQGYSTQTPYSRQEPLAPQAPLSPSP